MTAQLDLAAHRQLEWRQWWCRQPSRHRDTAARLDKLAQSAREHPLQAITGDQVTEALYSFKDQTGQSLDRLGPRHFKHLPPAAHQRVADLLNDCERKGCWPWQALSALIVLLGKQDGGERPIGLLNFLMRIYCRTRRPVTRAWTDKWAAHWDYAVRGSSSLRSALLLRLGIEVARFRNEDWAVILFDLTKFYDSIMLPAFLGRAAERHYPPAVMQLLVHGYLAARIVRSGPCCSEWVQPTSSITAGCGEANNVARVALYSIAEAATACSPLCQLSQFVDDLKLFAKAPSEPRLLQTVVPPAQSLVRGMQGSDFVFSRKSVILASPGGIANVLRASMQQEGIDVRVDEVAKDLGVDVTSQRRRRVPLQLRRIKQGLARAKKVIKLTLKAARRRAFTCSVLPKCTYGAAINGWPQSWIQKVRAAKAKTAGCRPGWSATAFFAVEGLSDPAVELPAMVIAGFLDLWLSTPAVRQDIEDAWPAQAGLTWAKVCGPLQAVVMTLADAGWVAASSTAWTDPTGEQYVLADEPVDVRAFLEHFKRQLQHRQWARAASGHLGGGLQSGGDLRHAQLLVKRLRKKGEAMKAGLAVALVSGGMWPKARCHATSYGTLPT